MSKRTVPTLFSTPGFDLDYAPFSIDGLQEIIAVVAPPSARANREFLASVVEHLNTAAIWRKYSLESAKVPTRLQEQEYLVRFKKLMQKLLGMVPAKAVVEEVNVPGGFARLLDPAMRAVVQKHLKEDADYVMNLQSSLGITSPAAIFDHLNKVSELLIEAIDLELTNREDPAIEGGPNEQQTPHLPADREFCRTLMGFYTVLFDRKIRISRDSVTKAPTGPLIRFLRACFAQISDKPPADETLVSWVDAERKAIISPKTG